MGSSGNIRKYVKISAYFDISPKLLFFVSEIYVFSIAHFKLEKEKLEKNQKVMTKKYPKHTNLFKSWEGEKGKIIFQAFKITCGTQSQQKNAWVVIYEAYLSLMEKEEYLLLSASRQRNQTIVAIYIPQY